MLVDCSVPLRVCSPVMLSWVTLVFGLLVSWFAVWLLLVYVVRLLVAGI